MKTTRNEKKLPPFCPACDAEGKIWKRREKTLERVFRNETFRVKGHVTECERCGFGIMQDPDSEDLVRRTWNAYRKMHQLLTSEEIISRRKALRLTQKQFAQYLDVGIASVKRWEKGLVQDKSSDRLIREMTEGDGSRRDIEVANQLIREGLKTPPKQIREEVLRRLKHIQWTAPARCKAVGFLVSDQPFHLDMEFELGTEAGVHMRPSRDDLPWSYFANTPEESEEGETRFGFPTHAITKRKEEKEDVLAATA